VHWILACVFVRFVEDNGLVERPFLSGPGERLRLARDRHEAFFRADPRAEERDFLHACFREAAALPGLGPLFADTRHNPLWRLPVSSDGAMALRRFFQEADPDTSELRRDFTDAQLGTRFLGDLYQDLSEAAKKRFALLQTPEFIEEFILDRTLEPAIREFGWRDVRLIDPTCGSGHFLLGAFHRPFDLWTRNEPARNTRDCAQKALAAVCGVDINPFAVAIARFRLLVVALNACGIARLRGAPDFCIEVATGDSLLHGRRFMDTRGWQQEMRFTPAPGMHHVYYEEDPDLLDRILGRQYHAVVGNPPYITVKDPALNEAYRQRYFTCYRSYSLAVPFTERFVDLTIPAENGSAAGFVGMITANSFMKREFGKKLIEQFLPRFDLTHVIDTAGAY
jgi:SAM-dependent methyltransferase